MDLVLRELEDESSWKGAPHDLIRLQEKGDKKYCDLRLYMVHGTTAVGRPAQDRSTIEPSTITRGRYREGHHPHRIHPTLHSDGADSVKV